MNLLKNIGKNIGVILLSLVVFILGTVVENVFGSFINNFYLKLIIPCILRCAFTLVFAWFVSKKVLKIEADELGVKAKKIDFILIILAIALPVLVLAFYAFILPGKAYIAREEMFWQYLTYAIFGVGLSAGITEEVIFRGMIFRYMKKTLGTKVAIIVPAVLFACLHIMNMMTFDVVDLVLLILAGSSVAVMFTFMALSSDSIYPGAIAHTLWNALVIGGVFGVGEIVNGMVNDSYIIIPVESTSKILTGGNFGVEAAVPAIVGYILVSIICFILYKKRTNK